MTRNTKLHKTKVTLNGKEEVVLFRDLTAGELGFLNNIKNDATRAEFAGRLALYDRNHKDLSWAILMQIGQKSMDQSNVIFSNDVLFEMTVKDIRNKIDNDTLLTAITFILKVLPGQSITDLLNLTPMDLIEIVCICEKIIGQNLLEFGEKKQKSKMNLINPESLTPEQTKNLRQQIANLNSTVGIPR